MLQHKIDGEMNCIGTLQNIADTVMSGCDEGYSTRKYYF